MVEFTGRGYFSSQKEGLKITIKDANNEPKFEVTGKYTESLDLKDLSTGEVKELWQCPNYLPPNADKMFNMSTFGLQLNMISDELLEKLPPTDSRRRKDIRAWEAKNVPVSSTDKDRLETNQRARKKKVKETLQIKEGKDETWYNPLWFKRARHPVLDTDYYEF